MIKQDTALFSNNCGKLYRNKVVFASHKESIDPQSIKNIVLRKYISKGNLLFIILFPVFFSIPFFVHELFEKVLFIVIGVSVMLLSVIMAKKHSSIHVTLKDGKKYRFKIWHGYVREAQKFVDETRKLVARRSQQEEAAEERVPEMVENNQIPATK
jgi:hypothetical protein